LLSQLSELKQRPVSALDIREYLNSQPESDFGYIQNWGQILIKAAIPRPSPIPVAHQVGIFRNKTYYAPDKDPKWLELFQRFCAHHRAEYLVIRGFLTTFSKNVRKAPALEQTAAWSLHQIIEATVPLLDCRALASHLQLWQDLHPIKSASLLAHRHIDRKSALCVLKQEVDLRAPYIESMNYNRVMARVSPTILRGRLDPYYSRELIHAYCSAQWPEKNQNMESEAVSLLHWILAMMHFAKNAS
jgi:hypothetical protein